jgi:hypothetical protein
MDVLCGYKHRVFPRHARRKGCAHKPNELFQVIASIAGVIRHRDLLHCVISTPVWIGLQTIRTWAENPSMGFL